MLQPFCVRNDPHGQECDSGGEDQAVQEDDESRTFEILQLRRSDFPIHLSHALFAAHRKQRMAKPDQNCDRRDGWRNCALQPSQRVVAEMQVIRSRPGNGVVTHPGDGQNAPDDQDHDHGRRNLHDAQGLFARLRNADDVLSPEVCGYENRKAGGKVVG